MIEQFPVFRVFRGVAAGCDSASSAWSIDPAR